MLEPAYLPQCLCFQEENHSCSSSVGVEKDLCPVISVFWELMGKPRQKEPLLYDCGAVQFFSEVEVTVAGRNEHDMHTPAL